MSEYLHEEEAIGKAYDLRLLRRLWHYVAPYRVQVLGTLLLVAPIFLLELAPAWVIKTAIEDVTGTPAQGATAWIADWIRPPAAVGPFVWYGALYLLASFTGAFLGFLNMVLMTTTGQSAMRHGQTLMARSASSSRRMPKSSRACPSKSWL